MRRVWFTRFCGLLATILVPTVSFAYLSYPTTEGSIGGAAVNAAGGTVLMWLNSFGQAIPSSLSNPMPTSPGSLTIVPLRISAVTTGGTAITALNAGDATKGGFVITSNAAGICIDQVTTAGVATGTPSTTVCVAQDQSYTLTANSHAVSVNSTASSVSLAGQGQN
jgi:hypothetical protein